MRMEPGPNPADQKRTVRVKRRQITHAIRHTYMSLPTPETPDPHPEFELAQRIRRATTFRELHQKLSDNLPPDRHPTPTAVAQLAIAHAQGRVPSDDDTLAERCHEILPTPIKENHPEKTRDNPPPTGWKRWWRDIEEQDILARDTLAAKHQRLVRYAVSQHLYGRMEIADLKQAANVGLAEAINHYDERYGVRFSTYATWWIRGMIQRGIALDARSVRLPQPMWENGRKIHAAASRLSLEMGREPTHAEIADAAGLTTNYVTEYFRHNHQVLSLDNPTPQEDEDGQNTIRVQDLIPNAPGPEAEVMEQAMRRDVRHAVAQLDERQQHIIRAGFGIGTERLTWKEIGHALGLTANGAYSAKTRALSKLAPIMTDHQLFLYL